MFALFHLQLTKTNWKSNLIWKNTVNDNTDSNNIYCRKMFVLLIEYSSIRSSDTCYYGDGISYTGNTNYTVNGVSCRPWSDNPYINNITYPTLIKNYCRNPQSIGLKPWCYTRVDRNKWDYCPVEQCSDGNASFSLYNVFMFFVIISWQFINSFMIKWKQNNQ